MSTPMQRLWLAIEEGDLEGIEGAFLAANRAVTKLVEASGSAQAALNPLSGFLRKGTAVDRRHIEKVREGLREGLKPFERNWRDAS